MGKEGKGRLGWQVCAAGDGSCTGHAQTSVSQLVACSLHSGRVAGRPGDEAGPASQGGAQSGAPGSGHWALPSPISSVSLSLGEWRQEAGCWEAELPREGSPLRGGPAAEPRQAGRRLLEPWKEPGITESWGRCQPGAAEGAGAAYGAPASSARLRSLPSRFLSAPGVRSRDGDRGLCLRGLQRWAPGLQQPPPAGSHSAWAETQKGR